MKPIGLTVGLAKMKVYSVSGYYSILQADGRILKVKMPPRRSRSEIELLLKFLKIKTVVVT